MVGLDELLICDWTELPAPRCCLVLLLSPPRRMRVRRLRYSDRAAQKSEGPDKFLAEPRAFLLRTPHGHGRRAFMPFLHGFVQCLPGCAVQWNPSNHIGCMAAHAVASRCTSAAAAIGGRFTVRGSAPEFAGGRRVSVPVCAIKPAIRAPRSMPPGSTDGARENATQNKK